MNVVFIVLDALRKDRVSVYSEEIDFTDNLKKFSEDATVFTDAVANAPWTLPSHASMFTGEYPWEHGATQRKPYLETDKELLAEYFFRKGYRTACFTFNGFLNSSSGLTDGFQQVDNFTGTLDIVPDSIIKKWNSWLAQDGLETLKSFIQNTGLRIFHSRFGETSNGEKVLSRSREFIEDSIESSENFFAFVNLMEAHEPYFPSEEYREKHAPDVNPRKVCQNPADHLSGRKEADFDDIFALYDASVDEMDDQLGEFLDFLGDLDEEITVVICSDHGQLLGENNLYGHQLSVAEELVSVPLIVKSPQLEAENVEKTMELRELYVKIREWSGHDVDEQLPEEEFSLGGYEFPDLFMKTLPDSKREQFYRRLRFARKDGKKLTESKNEDGEKEHEMIELGNGQEIDIDDFFIDRLEKIGDEVPEGDLEAEDEIKDRLEELGYM